MAPITVYPADVQLLDEEAIVIAAESLGPNARLELTDEAALTLADELTMLVERRRRNA